VIVYFELIKIDMKPIDLNSAASKVDVKSPTNQNIVKTPKVYKKKENLKKKQSFQFSKSSHTKKYIFR